MRNRFINNYGNVKISLNLKEKLIENVKLDLAKAALLLEENGFSENETNNPFQNIIGNCPINDINIYQNYKKELKKYNVYILIISNFVKLSNPIYTVLFKRVESGSRNELSSSMMLEFVKRKIQDYYYIENHSSL